MQIRENPDGPDLPQYATAESPTFTEADLPKMEPPPFGKAEGKFDAPYPCLVSDCRGGLHRGEVVGWECWAAREAGGSYVCLTCRAVFDDPTQGGLQPAAIRCPKCKKKGVTIIPAQSQGSRVQANGRPGETMYKVQIVEGHAEQLVDDPANPGQKTRKLVVIQIPPEERGTTTLRANQIRLL